MRIVIVVLSSLLTTATASAAIVNALPPGDLMPSDTSNVITFDGMKADRYGSTAPAGDFQIGDTRFSGTGLIMRNGEDGLRSDLGLYAEPYHDASNYMAVLGTGSETISFASVRQKFGLYWGSIDRYNNISFSIRGYQIASYSGADLGLLFPITFGDQHNDDANRYLSFSDIGDFDSVTISSGGNSFEFDNISSSVPEPSTWLMLLVGFVAMPLVGLRHGILRACAAACT